MRRPVINILIAGLVLSACSSSSSPPAASPSPEPPSSAAPEIALPAGPLRELVPGSKDLPAGMVPILAGTGPRDVRAVAGYSADPTAAQKQLTTHGFRTAYVGQYADPATGRVLSVVVSRFATPAGATADLSGDLAASGGSVVPTPTVGDQSEVRRQPLPPAAGTASPTASGSASQLVTVRFRKGATTWLVAFGASPTADPEVPLGIAKMLAAKV